MQAITNFSLIQFMNSLLNPLGFTISYERQIINKVALAAIAMLAVASELSMVEGKTWSTRTAANFSECAEVCRRIGRNPNDKDAFGRNLLDSCMDICRAKFPALYSS